MGRVFFNDIYLSKDYKLVFEKPDGYDNFFPKDVDGANKAKDSDADKVTGETEEFSLNPGFTVKDAGTDETKDLDANPNPMAGVTFGRMENIPLAPIETNNLFNAGLIIKPGSISGTVWHNVDCNGI